MLVVDAINQRISVGDIVIQRDTYGEIKPCVITSGTVKLANVQLKAYSINGSTVQFDGQNQFQNLIVVTPQYISNNDIEWVKEAEKCIYKYAFDDKRPQEPSDVIIPLHKFLDKALTHEFLEVSRWGRNAVTGSYGYNKEPVLKDGKRVVNKSSCLTIGDEKVRFELSVSTPLPKPNPIDHTETREWVNGDPTFRYGELSIDSYKMYFNSNGKVAYNPAPLVIDGLNIFEDDAVIECVEKIAERCKNS